MDVTDIPFDDWCCIFSSSIEPGGEGYQSLLGDLIFWMELIIKNEPIPNSDPEIKNKLITHVIPNAISQFLEFSSVNSESEKKLIIKFFKNAASVAVFSIINNYMSAFPSIIQLFNFSNQFYYKYSLANKLAVRYLRDENDIREAFSSFPKGDFKPTIEMFNVIFCILFNISKSSQYRDQYLDSMGFFFDCFLFFLDQINILRNVDTQILKNIFEIIFKINIGIIDFDDMKQLMSFFVRCLKSDFLDKQLFAAQQICKLCMTPHQQKYLLQINEEIDIVGLMVKQNFHSEVIIQLNEFLTLLAVNHQIRYEHLTQLWEKSKTLHITEREGALDLIANFLNYFDIPEIKKYINYLDNQKKDESYYLFSKIIANMQGNEDKAVIISDLTNILLQHSNLNEAQNAILKVCINKTSTLTREKIALHAARLLKDESCIDFAQKTILQLIRTSSCVNVIFNQEYVSNLINSINAGKFDNRRAIFSILQELFTFLQFTSETLNKLISIKADDVLWELFGGLLVKDSNFFPDDTTALETAAKSQDFKKATVFFARFLYAFIYFKNKNIFNCVKKRNNLIESFVLESFDLKNFDLLMNLYLNVSDKEVALEVKTFLLKLYLNCSKSSMSTKDIQQRIRQRFDKLGQLSEGHEYNKISSELDVRLLELMYEYLVKAEAKIDPEDFDMPRHKIPEKYIKVFIVRDNYECMIHIDKNSTLDYLRRRIATRAKTKDDFIIFPQFANEKGNPKLTELGIKNRSRVIWDKKDMPHNVKQVIALPPSCELHKNMFSDRLLELFDQSPSHDVSKLIWKILKFLPTNEAASKTLADFDLFVNTVQKMSHKLKIRYYLQILYKGNSKVFFQNNGLNFLVDYFIKSKIYPIGEVLKIFNKIYKTDELNMYAQQIVIQLLWCIINRNKKKICIDLLYKFLSKIPDETTKIIFMNYDILNNAINNLEEDYWPKFIDFFSKANNIIEVTNLCIERINDNTKNIAFYIRLLSKITPKLSDLLIPKNSQPSDLSGQSDDQNANTLLSESFDICIGLLPSDNSSNFIYILDVLDLLLNILQLQNIEYLKLSFGQIPYQKLLDLAFENTDKDSQENIFSILKIIMKEDNTCADYVLNKTKNMLSHEIDRWNYSPLQSRRNQPYAGLKNLGATCFANSVFQQIYHLFPIRYLTLTYKFDPTSEYSNLQHLFKQMMLTERSYCDTSVFLSHWHGWYGKTINTREQQDSLEFLLLLLDDDKSKDHFPTEITSWFKGEMTNSFIGVDDTFRTEKIETFYNISLSIKKFVNTEDSFAEFKQMETMNDYECENPKRKITVQKYSRISKPPIILVIQLKRFEYDVKTFSRYKINDRFIFPIDLDISEICKCQTSDNNISDNNNNNKSSNNSNNNNNIDNNNNNYDNIKDASDHNNGKSDACKKTEAEQSSSSSEINSSFQYELHGIVVHSGTAIGGHYFSFIKKKVKNVNEWYLFNDNEVSKVDREDEVMSISHGKNNDNTSAYLLFYVQKDFQKVYFAQNESNKPVELNFNNEFNFNNEIQADDIIVDNKMFKQAQAVFATPVQNFVSSINDFELNMMYFVNVLCHSKDNNQSHSFRCHLINIIDHQHKEMECIRYFLANSVNIFNNYLKCSNTAIINDFNEVIAHCVRAVDADPELCFKMCELLFKMLKENIFAYRQILPVLALIEVCISLFTDFALENNWFSKECELLDITYQSPRTSIYMTSCDFSSVFRSLEKLIQKMPAKSIECTQILFYSQYILKSNNNQKAYSDLLFMCTKCQNLSIESAFDLLLTTSDSSEIIRKYFSDLVCTSSGSEIQESIHKFICESNPVLTIKQKSNILIECFLKEIHESSSVFIQHFLKQSPFIIRDILTSSEEIIRNQCENLFYVIFPKNEKMEKTPNLRTPSSSSSVISSFLQCSGDLFSNQMHQLLDNFRDFISSLSSSFEEFSPPMIPFRFNSESTEPGFRLVSTLRLYRWLTHSLNSYDRKEIEIILNWIRAFRNSSKHRPDFHINQLVYFLIDFPQNMIAGELYEAFIFIFSDINQEPEISEDLSLFVISEEMGPFFSLFSTKNHIYDIIKILNDPIFKIIFFKYLSKPNNKYLKAILNVVREINSEHPQSLVIGGSDFHGELIDQAKSFTMKYDLFKLSLPNPSSEALLKMISAVFQKLIDSPDQTSDECVNTIISIKPDENLGPLEITVNDILEKYKQNIGPVFKIIGWHWNYSNEGRENMPKFIRGIFESKTNEMIIKSTAELAAIFDFRTKNAKLLRAHDNMLSSLGNLNIISKKTTFISHLSKEIKSSKKGDIEWMFEYSQSLFQQLDIGSQPAYKDFLAEFSAKISDDSLLKIYSALENSFIEINEKDHKLLTFKNLALIVGQCKPLLPRIRESTKLTKDKLKTMNEMSPIIIMKEMSIMNQILGNDDDTTTIVEL